MLSLEYDSQAGKPLRRRPPPSQIDPNATNASSRGAGIAQAAGAMVPVQLVPVGPMASGQRLQGGAGRLQPAVANTLAVLAGPTNRPPLVHSGDPASSLAALRQDISSAYHALCSITGDPPRADLLTGALPAAASLGISLPSSSAPSSAAALPALGRLPRIAGPPLLLPPPPLPGISGGGGFAPGLGGIEAVGSGLSGGGAVMAGISRSGDGSSGGGALQALSIGGQMGGLRSLSAGHVSLYTPQVQLSGLPWRQAAAAGQQGWPLGRPSAPAGGVLAAGGMLAAAARGAADMPRIGAASGFSRPQDPSSDFLGEESALVYPPPGRSYGGAASRASNVAPWAFRGGGGGGGGIGGFGGGFGGMGGSVIDPMDDFRFRSNSRKAIHVDPLGGLPGLGAGGRGADSDRAESFLRDFARDRSNAATDDGAGDGKSRRYKMPF